MHNKHAEMLPEMVNRALDFIEKNAVLSAVAICKGPGSYTGLRIGTSMAKGICYAKQVPLMSVNGFLGMALQGFEKYADAEFAIAMLDARRDDVYLQVFNREGNAVSEMAAVTLVEDTLPDYASKKVVICGNSNTKWQQLVGGFNQIEFSDSEPHAAFCAKEAVAKFHNSQFEDSAYFQPFYLKDFIPGISKKFAL